MKLMPASSTALSTASACSDVTARLLSDCPTPPDAPRISIAP